jgi:hypothetical protein
MRKPREFNRDRRKKYFQSNSLGFLIGWMLLCAREILKEKKKHAKVSLQKKTRWLFFCSLKFLDEKNCKRKKVEFDKEVQESSRSFFAEIRKKCDNFCSIWKFFN